jgi:NADP-dependent 3-hydroxy acid dehydrogenase YdfG
MANNIMVWGANGDIGSTLCGLLVDKGWQVAAFARSNSRLPEQAYFIEADVADHHSVDRAIYTAAQEFENFDAYVYTAGDIAAQEFAATSEQLWQQIGDANLMGVYRSLRASLPLLTEDASVIVIGAQSEKISIPGLSIYAAAKAGLSAFMTSVAKEDRRRKYLLLRPLAVSTRFWDKVPFAQPKSALAAREVAMAIIESIETKTTGTLDIP